MDGVGIRLRFTPPVAGNSGSGGAACSFQADLPETFPVNDMATRAQAAGPEDAIALLTAGHDTVRKLFKDFEHLHKRGSDDEAEKVASRICRELTVHATLKDEIFHPEVRAAVDDEDPMKAPRSSRRPQES